MKKPERPYMDKYYPDVPPELDEKVLFSKTLVDRECVEQYIERYQEENETDENPEFECLENNNVLFSVQDLLDKVPIGTKPKDVFVSISQDRYRESITYCLYQIIPFNKELWQEEKNKAIKEYNIKLQKYNEEKEQYDIWEAEQQLLAAQNKLQKLKST